MVETQHAIYNGKVDVLGSGVVPVGNRGFHYGDGLFESIRIINGKPCFLDNHVNRFKQGLLAMKIKPDDSFSWGKIERELLQLIGLNGIEKGGRARITMTRSSPGFYSPQAEVGMDYLIEAEAIDSNQFSLNDRGMEINVFQEIPKQINSLSRFKTLNCQIYIMASLYARENQLDNALILNDKDCIIESANSNIFLVSNRVLYTPPLEDGCVGGTMRMEVINTALRHDIKVYETSLRPQNLLVADELFLTNAIQGVQWVSAYRQKRYFHEMAGQVIGYLNDSVL